MKGKAKPKGHWVLVGSKHSILWVTFSTYTEDELKLFESEIVGGPFETYKAGQALQRELNRMIEL